MQIAPGCLRNCGHIVSESRRTTRRSCSVTGWFCTASNACSCLETGSTPSWTLGCRSSGPPWTSHPCPAWRRSRWSRVSQLIVCLLYMQILLKCKNKDAFIEKVTVGYFSQKKRCDDIWIFWNSYHAELLWLFDNSWRHRYALLDIWLVLFSYTNLLSYSSAPWFERAGENGGIADESYRHSSRSLHVQQRSTEKTAFLFVDSREDCRTPNIKSRGSSTHVLF